jgi:betaine-aldehyde dehydrogenase
MSAKADHRHGLMLIGGELVESEGGERHVSTDPATEEAIGSTPAGTAKDVEHAVAAAETAAKSWAALSVNERGDYLRRLAAGLKAREAEVLDLEVRDTGATIAKMRADVASAGHALEHYAGLGLEVKGQTIPASTDHLHLTVREPYGLVGRIIPFNHPIKFAANSLAAPLMAGNAVILKPPEQSPLSATILAEICREVLPPGLVNIVTGHGMPVGDAIARHPAIRRIGFTGSVSTGLAIQRAAASSAVKHVSLELGGKNPLIAFPDMDPDVIATAAVRGMNFSWQGQSCGSTSRLMLHESLHDAVLDRVLAHVAEIRMGSPLEESTQMGPINSARHYERVCAMVEAGHQDGARLLIGGKRPEGKMFQRGYWLQPTVFGDVKQGMRIAQEEIFGPVLSVFKWQDEQEVFDLANSTDYGLTASIWTNDLKTALRAARAVKSGYVWINGTSAHFAGTPFGGTKNSGLGREEDTNELFSYTELKTIHIALR